MTKLCQQQIFKMNEFFGQGDRDGKKRHFNKSIFISRGAEKISLTHQIATGCRNEW